MDRRVRSSVTGLIHPRANVGWEGQRQRHQLLQGNEIRPPKRSIGSLTYQWEIFRLLSGVGCLGKFLHAYCLLKKCSDVLGPSTGVS
jgi:hypothetical protein